MIWFWIYLGGAALALLVYGIIAGAQPDPRDRLGALQVVLIWPVWLALTIGMMIGAKLSNHRRPL